MDALTQVEWTVAGEVIDEFGAELDKIVKNDTYVDTTAAGFLMHFTNTLIERIDAHRAEENAAWDDHEQRESFADYHMI